MYKVLIIEDDIVFATMLKKWFVKNGFAITLCSNLADAKKSLLSESFNLALSDLRLPDGEGTILLSFVKENSIKLPFIMMTSYAQVQNAVEAIKLGAEDYLEKPIDPSILKEKIEKILKIGAKQESVPSKEASSDRKIIIGNSPAAIKMYDYILKVAPTKLSILILGESGTGKEYAANLIHNNSTRKNMPFVAVDCGSLSKELAASELFGHKKGSFTSAINDKVGVFEQADGGTVFLDEIGNLSYEVQVQLLRALQEQKIRPVGSAVDKSVDVRIIAATNENLEQAIAQGRFREDLYHRLNEFSLFMPPLRERKEDIGLFANNFLQLANKELGKNITSFTEQAMEKLEQGNWSGNLRELRNVIRRAALFANADTIGASDLPEILAKDEKVVMHCNEGLQPDNELEQIKEALRITRGNKSKAAQMLKIDRKTLYNKLAKYGLS